MWSNFIPCSEEDETICNDYCINPLFKITKSGDLTKNYENQLTTLPSIKCEVENKKMALAIDDNLFLLEHQSFAECSYLGFGSPIEAMCISNSGNIIICALSDGNVHGVHIKGTPIFNVTISRDDISKKNGVQTFIGINQKNNNFYLMCSTDRIYRLFNVDEANLCESMLLSENNTMNDTLLNNVSIECISNVDGTNQLINSVCLLETDGGFGSSSLMAVLCGRDNEFIHFDEINLTGRHMVAADKTTNPMQRHTIKMPTKFQNFKSVHNLDNFIIGLGIDGNLYKICPFTLTVSDCRHQKNNVPISNIDDVIVLQCNEDTIELLLLTKPSKTGDRTMKIVDFPSMKCTYEHVVPKYTWLIRQPKSAINMYYLNGNSAIETDLPGEIVLKQISENKPKERLKKLIHCGHLDEAEEYARKFNLDLQPIFETKCKRLMAEIRSNKQKTTYFPKNSLEVQFTELIKLASQIEDIIFVLNLRNVDLGDRNLMNNFLLFLLNIDGIKHHQGIFDEITENILRFATLKMIDPNEIMDWQIFVYHPNIMLMVMELFKQDMSKACLIWKQHSSSILPFKSDTIFDNFRQLFAALPSNTLLFDIILWIRHFVPVISHVHAELMPLIVDWCIEKTQSLQYSNHWPVIGLEFITSILTVCSEVKYLFSNMDRQYEGNLEKMQTIINVLQDITVLKTSYNLTMTLDDYLIDNIEDTAFHILQRVNLKFLRCLTEDFLYPIFLEKGLTPINAIKRYINFLVKHHKIIHLWQERAVVLVELLHNEEERLENALNILKAAPVPWTDAVAPLLKYRLSGHPLATDITTEYDLQKIKILKKKYGWPIEAVSSAQLLGQRIVYINSDDLIEDIHTLVNANASDGCDINSYCACALVSQKNDLEKAFDFLNSLDKRTSTKEELIKCCERIMAVCSSLIDTNEHSEEKTNNYLELMKFVNEKLANILNNDNVNSTYELHSGQYVDAQKIEELRNRFDIDVCLTDLSKKNVRQLFLQQGIIAIYNSLKRKLTMATTTAPKVSNIISNLWNDIGVLSKILKIDKIYATIQLLEHIGNIYVSCSMAKLVLDLHDSIDSTNSTNFLNLAILLILQQIESFDLPTDKHNFKLPMSYPLAFRLLKLAGDCGKMMEIDEILCWIAIGTSAYTLNETDEFFNVVNNTEFNTEWDAYAENQLIQLNSNDSFTNGGGDKKLSNTERRESLSVFDNVINSDSSTSKIVEPKIYKTKNHNPESIIKCISMAMKIFLCLETKNCQPFKQMLNVFHHQIISLWNPNCLNDAKDEFIASLEYLLKTKQYSAAFKIIKIVLKYQSLAATSTISNKIPVVILPPTFVTSINKKILRYMLSKEKEPNFLDILSILKSDAQPSNCLSYLAAELKFGQMKNNYLTLLEMYHRSIGSYNCPYQIDLDENVRKKYFYFTELLKIDASLKVKTELKFDSIGELLNQLQVHRLDISLLSRISTDFLWDFQRVLVTQIIHILKKQELEFTIKLDSVNQEQLCIQSLSPEEMHALCKPYINELANNDLLARELRNFIDRINFCFYELYLCVISILKYIDRLPFEMKLWENVLLFLKHKMVIKRRKIGQIETDSWLNSQSGVVPAIAKFRFPFMIIIKKSLRDILVEEVTVQNCVQWFPLIRLCADIVRSMNQDEKLGGSDGGGGGGNDGSGGSGIAHGLMSPTEQLPHVDSQDYFCMVAVKHSIFEYKNSPTSALPSVTKAFHDEQSGGVGGSNGGNNGSGKKSWNLYPINNAFLQSILRLLNHMTDVKKKCFILYFITSEAPEGADQVEAAHECYKFVKFHEKELMQQQRSEEIVQNIKRQYPMYYTKHLLHLYGLTDDRLFSLVYQPMELIDALYSHAFIINSQKCDINKVAAEIADLHQLNFTDIQLTILEQTFSNSTDDQFGIGGGSGNGDANETFYEDLNVSINVNDGLDQGNRMNAVLRIHFILSSWEQEKALTFLISRIFPYDGSVDTGKELQAFECFIKLNNQKSESIENSPKDLFADLITQEQYTSLICVHHLKQLGYTFSIEKFKNYDKLSLLSKMFKSYSTNPLALEVMSYVCVGYDIFIDKIWNCILRQMVSLKMIKQLNSLVDLLTTKKTLLHTDGLAKAWQYIISSPFGMANKTRSFEQEQQLCQSLFLLQSCPLKLKLNIIDIAQSLLRLERPHMVAILIAFANETEKLQIIKMLEKCPNLKKKDIEELGEFGIYPIVINQVIQDLELQ